MNFFGVGPLELFFILILGLIVLGPERLPEVGRFLGRKLAQLMAWQQQSPEAQMIQQIRQDFEQEIVELRDELVRARAQFNVNEDMQKLREETRAMLSLKDKEIAAARANNPAPTVSAAQAPNKIASDPPATNGSTGAPPAAGQPASTDAIAPPAESASVTTDPATATPDNAAPTKTVARRPRDDDPEWAKRPHPSKLNQSAGHGPTNNGLAPARTTVPVASSADVQVLQAQIETLMAEIHELHAQLRSYHAGNVRQDESPQLLEMK